MKQLFLILLIIIPTVLTAQKYSKITFEPFSDDKHWIVNYFVNDTLFNQSQYLCDEPVNEENFTFLQKSGKLIHDGLSIQFFPTGKEMIIIPFSNGQIDGTVKMNYPSGNLKWQSEWKAGQQSGSFSSYFEDGSKQVESNFDLGLKSGKEKVYFQNGKVRALLNYRQGKLNGKQTTFFPNGKKKKNFRYEDNFDVDFKRISFEKYIKSPRLFTIPLNTYPIEDLLNNSVLPDISANNSAITLEILIGCDGKVKEILDYGTISEQNIQFFDQLFKKITPLDTARFDNSPIEYTMILPLKFYKGSYVSTCQSVIPSWELTNLFENSFWRTRFHFKSKWIKNPEPQKSPEDLADALTRKNKGLNKDKVKKMVEVMPEFPGGEPALRKFIARTVRYPVDAAKNKEQGRVYIQFVVDTDGTITNIKVAKGVSPLLDAESIRVVKSMPNWKPGTQDGKPVRVSYTVPISFRLQ